MKREIVFRAKEADSNFWVFGDLINGVHCKYIGSIKYGENLLDRFYHNEPVQENTILEFTGYREPYTRTMIFEGDLLSNNLNTDKEVIREVVLKEGKWMMRRVIGKSRLENELLLHEHYQLNYKVVGNIIDNPEFCCAKNKNIA